MKRPILTLSSLVMMTAMFIVAAEKTADHECTGKNRPFMLKTRYYRTRPIDQPGYENETFLLDPKKTAIVLMHLWDIGCEGGPAVDPHYFVGMGMPENFREAERIIKRVILPTVAAARRAGLLVCHVTHEWIGKRDPRAQKLTGSAGRNRTERITVSPGAGEPGRFEAVLGWRQGIEERAYGKDFLTKSPLAVMKESALVDILPGEPYVYESERLGQIFRDRGIENIIYTGFATDVCVLNAGGGVEPMAAQSYRLFLMRDATLGIELPDTFPERRSTRYAIRYFEIHYGNSLLSRDFMESCRRLRP
jgi:nicotinamidase-related amidase